MEQLFGAISSVVGRMGPHDEINEAIVLASWLQCAGDLLRERTNAVKFSNKRLVIAVPDKTWQRHLEELSPQMLASINRSLGHGTVRFIEFRIDESAVRDTRQNPAARERSDAMNITKSLTKAAEAITDENLKKQFVKTAAIYLEKQKTL